MRARRITVRSQEFVLYGLVEDGSAERNAYIHNLQGYMAGVLLPLFGAWAGELPPHLQKARAAACRPHDVIGSPPASPSPAVAPLPCCSLPGCS